MHIEQIPLPSSSYIVAVVACLTTVISPQNCLCIPKNPPEQKTRQQVKICTFLYLKWINLKAESDHFWTTRACALHAYILLQELVQNRTGVRNLAHFPIKYEHFTHRTADLRSLWIQCIVHRRSKCFKCKFNSFLSFFRFQNKLNRCRFIYIGCMKETPRRRITVTSSLNEIYGNQLLNW